MKLSFEIKYYIFFIILLLGILILGIFSAKNNAKLKETNEWVDETYEIKESTEHLLSLTKDIGVGTRGYLITGDSAFLNSFIEANENIPSNLQHVKDLVRDISQQQRLDTLSNLINQYIEFSIENVTIKNKGELSDSSNISIFYGGRDFMSQIRNLVVRIQERQGVLLNERKAANDESVTEFNLRFNILIICTVLFLVVAFFVNRHNILARVKAEEEQSILFKTAIDLICVAGTDGYFKRINPAFEKILGYSKNELLSVPFIQFVHPEDLESTTETVKDLENGISVVNFKNRYRCKDGSYKWLEWAATGLGEKIYATARDITPRIQAEEEILEINKELDSFSYSVSHDLRAPLRAIVGYSNILIEDYYEKFDEEGKKILNIIVKNGLRMGKLIDDLLTFSRINKQNVIKVKVDMNSLVRSVIAEYSLEELKMVEVNIKNLSNAYCDSNMMKQVMINLISNSIKYSSKSEKPLIEIGGYRENGSEIFYIKDNGVGFDMQHYDKLFGVFQRLHSTGEFEGTGVGLALVQRIIHKHQGKVWAEGKINDGATFYFSLPVNNLN